MILVKLLKDLTSHGLFATEVAGLDDALAERLIKQNRAERVGEDTAAAGPTSDLSQKTVSELREQAEALGVELPHGYVRKDELVEAIEAGPQAVAAEVEHDDEDDEEDDAETVSAAPRRGRPRKRF